MNSVGGSANDVDSHDDDDYDESHDFNDEDGNDLCLYCRTLLMTQIQFFPERSSSIVSAVCQI